MDVLEYIAASKAAPRKPPMSEPPRDLDAEDPDWLWFRDNADAGIRGAVELLRRHWFETADSCQGGEGHASLLPSVTFAGDDSAGAAAWRLLDAAGWKPCLMRLVRHYCPGCDELAGPLWEVTLDLAVIEAGGPDRVAEAAQRQEV